MLAVLAVGLEARDDALALQHADGVAVEGDVDLADAADHLAVVVDRLRALGRGGLLDRDGRAGVELGEDEHLGAVGQALVGLVALLLGVALRVVDDVGDARLLERRPEQGPVELLPAHRRLGVRQQDADLDARLRARCPALRDRRSHAGDRDERDPEGGDELLHSRFLSSGRARTFVGICT